MRLAIALGVAVGFFLGIGGYTFIYARGYSYLTDDPQACVNCHVMQEQYSGWIASSHRAAAVCNDCHTPHDFLGKYLTKTRNGFWHSFYFTTGRFPDPIQITSRNAGITERSCRSCHDTVVQAIDPTSHGAAALSCVNCHRSVGHLH
jgi:cytochrome c nitrite reductase small subunit